MSQPIITRLETAVENIERNARLSDEHLLATAVELAEIKALLDKRGWPRWRVWSAEKLTLGETRIRELVRIGRAADPTAELARMRDRNSARQSRLRTKRATARRAQPASVTHPTPEPTAASRPPSPPLHPNAQRVVDWANAAPLHHIRQVLAFIDTLSSRHIGKTRAAREAKRDAAAHAPMAPSFYEPAPLKPMHTPHRPMQSSLTPTDQLVMDPPRPLPTHGGVTYTPLRPHKPPRSIPRHQRSPFAKSWRGK